MRITNGMIADNFLYDMNNNLENLKILQDQRTSGKQFRKPSDDPFKVARAMQLHSSINANKQYNMNITDTLNWLDTTDTAVGQMGNALQRVRELLIASGNAPYGTSERGKIKDEINEIVTQVSQVLNTNFDGKYIFGGTRGTSRPITTKVDSTTKNVSLSYAKKDGTPMSEGDPGTDDDFTQIEEKLKTEISQGVIVDYNVSAKDVLKYGNNPGEDLRSLFSKIIGDLDDPTKTGELTNNDIIQIDKSMDNILKVRSEVGARSNRMETAKDQNGQMNFNMTEILSKTEDIDIAETAMNFETALTVYLSSLQTSARIIQPTLMDYIR